MSDLTLLQLKVLWEINKKPRCGYELMRINKKKITQGTMYPLLQSMERMKLIKKNAEKSKCLDAKCRCKKYYETTATGKKALKESSKNLCRMYKEIFKEYVCKRCKA